MLERELYGHLSLVKGTCLRRALHLKNEKATILPMGTVLVAPQGYGMNEPLKILCE